jgi:hypothetical protein
VSIPSLPYDHKVPCTKIGSKSTGLMYALSPKMLHRSSFVILKGPTKLFLRHKINDAASTTKVAEIAGCLYTYKNTEGREITAERSKLNPNFHASTHGWLPLHATSIKGSNSYRFLMRGPALGRGCGCSAIEKQARAWREVS